MLVQVYLILKTFSNHLTDGIPKEKHANKEHYGSGSVGEILHGIKLDRKRSRILNVPNTQTLQAKLCLAEIISL